MVQKAELFQSLETLIAPCAALLRPGAADRVFGHCTLLKCAMRNTPAPWR
ncbi:hypothetical protein L195_g060163, partial [Trifolium pratense]